MIVLSKTTYKRIYRVMIGLGLLTVFGTGGILPDIASHLTPYGWIAYITAVACGVICTIIGSLLRDEMSILLHSD